MTLVISIAVISVLLALWLTAHQHTWKAEKVRPAYYELRGKGGGGRGEEKGLCVVEVCSKCGQKRAYFDFGEITRDCTVLYAEQIEEARLVDYEK